MRSPVRLIIEGSGHLTVRADPVLVFRMLTLVEDRSFVILPVFGSLLSRISGIDLVAPLGMVYGALFVALLTVRRRLGWGTGTTTIVFLVGLLPSVRRA
ncbi:hypothetical protein HNP84_008784 [Thermocatellispora tengchongensis]|uniref:DUF3817 domain-containing protein n=1 Tax=Thermocatellispora tengchongensis TaxID=1073253 RepID=A0A840PML1_9ACTN|nr:DUF3817 domain-containing protein [Thermocatellispora tengchongensis]MBB5139021.1 hypothetical protein [Thermocatellispora tengchongensis]